MSLSLCYLFIGMGISEYRYKIVRSWSSLTKKNFIFQPPPDLALMLHMLSWTAMLSLSLQNSWQNWVFFGLYSNVNSDVEIMGLIFWVSLLKVG